MALEWPQLSKENTFTTVNAQANYGLPGDFEKFIARTNWDRTNRWELIGPMSAQDWQFKKSGITQVSPRRRFRIKGSADNVFYIDPTPDLGSDNETLVFEYQSKNWILPLTWTASTVFAALTYTSYNGNIYYTVAGGTTGSTAPTHTTGSTSDGGVTWLYKSGAGTTQVAYEKFLADTDVPILSERLIGLGVQWRFLMQKGFDYSDIFNQYLDLRGQEFVAIKGAKTLSLDRERMPIFIGPGSVPDTGYGS